jgi:hypothetical protein
VQKRYALSLSKQDAQALLWEGAEAGDIRWLAAGWLARLAGWLARLAGWLAGWLAG